MLKRRASKLLRAAALALVIALVLCEVGLRVLVATLPDGGDSWPAAVEWLHGDFRTLTATRYMNRDNQAATGDVTTVNYNIRHDERLTTDQPRSFTRNVWLLGSSSVWGVYADDGHTIASYLQRELNRRGVAWRVRNMAQPGIAARLELYWLKQADVRPGDVVIMVDGTVDHNWMLEQAQRWHKADTLPCVASERVPLLVLSMWCQSLTIGPVPDLWLVRSQQADLPRYWQTIAEARQWSQQHGAAYYHFIQPHRAEPATYANFVRGEPVLSVDAADFYDQLHYTPAGHATMARAMLDAVWPEF